MPAPDAPTAPSPATVSLAIAQQSLGPAGPRFPLMPVLAAGCPATSTEEVQYPLEVAFDYDRADPALFDRPPLPGLDRWAPLLPPLAAGLSMGEGGTPLIAVPGDGAAETVFLKDESRNPTFSHKDRLNLCTVSAARAAGAAGVVAASTGNHGVSAAAYAARAGLPAIVVATAGISAAFLSMLRAYGALVVPVAGEARWPAMRAIVAGTGFHPVSNLTAFHTGHPYGPEGYKTIAYELFLQCGRRVPQAVLVPTGYGEQLYGIHKGFRELRRLGLTQRIPRLYAVEPAARAPLARAFSGNAPVAAVAPAPTRQLSIACTVSGYRGLLALRESGGRALTVTDEAVLAAQGRLARLGLWQEFSGAAAYAALGQLRPEEAEGEIVALATATGLKDPADPAPLAEIEPDLAAVRRHLKREYGFSL